MNAYCGPNPFSDDPCVLAVLEIGEDALTTGPDRCAQLARMSAGWFAPPETDWDAPDRTQAIGTFLAAWALALLNKENGYLHTARAFRSDGRLLIALGYHHQRLTTDALRLAVELFQRIDSVAEAAIADTLQRFWRLSFLHHPDYQARFLMQAARAAGIPYSPFMMEHRLWQFGWGRNSNIFFESQPLQDSAIGWRLGRDKSATKAVLASLGVRTAPYVLARSEADLAAVETKLGWPCVAKPTSFGRSQGVTTDIDDPDKLLAAFRQAIALGKGHVIVERQVEGEVYRIMVVRGKTVCVIRRSAPFVTGDGQHSLRALIDAANLAIEAERAAAPYLGPIPFDDELRVQLHQQGWMLDDIAPRGTKVVLRRIPLLSTGATYRDATDEAHPDILTMAELVVKSLGLEMCGIDFISRDISRSCGEEGAVLEVNTTPGLRVPLLAGMAAEDIGRLALGEDIGPIPVTLVLASAPELDRLVETLRFGEKQAWVIPGRCGLGTLVLSDGSEASLEQLVSRALRNPLAADVTITCTPEQLTQHGLPVDRFEKIVACRVELDPLWRDVLMQRTRRWIDVENAAEAFEHLSAD